ncbi:hypothetical protein V1512DRAFT_10515 [Lipomyces arxii]|uniref:uncharacterized protein n=1 Tax=Lipomyces arxii TaxID=56418 RepID=UPI0034D01800
MSAAYHACYLDDRVQIPTTISHNAFATTVLAEEHKDVVHNLTKIASVFRNASSHSSVDSCLQFISSTSSTVPTVVFISMPSVASGKNVGKQFGPEFLLELHRQFSPQGNCVPVALVDDEVAEMAKYVDMGAVEVINRVIQEARLRGILVHIYRCSTKTPTPNGYQKAGWLGSNALASPISDEERLIDSLFNIMFFDATVHSNALPLALINFSEERAEYLKSVVFEWDFPVQDLTDDELMQCAYYMFKHAFTSMPEVKNLVLPDDELKRFLTVCRASYQPRNAYHNFRHVVDVLQATFSFLLSLGTIPSLDHSATQETTSGLLANVLGPVDALTLLVTAIGHDVGHPGVTNAFLVAARSPLARMYSERSVLESFHSATFSQILERYWPVMQKKPMKSVIVDAVFATDMALHFDYMNQLEELQHPNVLPAGRVDTKEKDRRKRLLCSVLVKSADISNVARRLDISTHWGQALTQEFKKMASLEIELGLKPAFAPTPEPPSTLTLAERDTVALAKSQLFFIDSFALPLFATVSAVLPKLSYTERHVRENKATWEALLAEIVNK